jgi:hypothetical protein
VVSLVLCDRHGSHGMTSSVVVPNRSYFRLKQRGAFKNFEISCVKTNLTIPLDRTLGSGGRLLLTIMCREDVHAPRSGSGSDGRVGVFAMADQGLALVFA